MEDINFTENAIKKVKEMLNDKKFKHEPIKGLRIYIHGGGCSGFSYEFAFETITSKDDTIIEQDSVNFIIDPISMSYLIGSTVDYEKKLFKEQFVVNNPNASATCGCGLSFSI